MSPDHASPPARQPERWRSPHVMPAFAALLIGCTCMAATALQAGSRAHALDHEQIVILYPGDDTTVFDDDGRIDVQLAIAPDLALRPGDRIELFLDGRRIRQQHGESFVLIKIPHGSHHLQARIVPVKGSAVIESLPVRFDIWQASQP